MSTDPPVSANQRATLIALADTVVPADEWSGAVDVGVPDYLLGQLAGDLADRADEYRMGLDALDCEADHRFRQSFAELSPAARAELLGSVENGAVHLHWPTEPAAFIAESSWRGSTATRATAATATPFPGG